MLVGILLNMILYGVSIYMAPFPIKELILPLRCCSFRFILMSAIHLNLEFNF